MIYCPSFMAAVLELIERPSYVGILDGSCISCLAYRLIPFILLSFSCSKLTDGIFIITCNFNCPLEDGIRNRSCSRTNHAVSQNPLLFHMGRCAVQKL